jgi:hypothetical protein
VYETKGSSDDMMMSGSEVVVANEEEVTEHEQVTIHYISAESTPGNLIKRKLFDFQKLITVILIFIALIKYKTNCLHDKKTHSSS